MATPAIIRRFRKELRELHDIQPDTVVQLQEDEVRSANIQAAKLLLNEAFNGRIEVRVSADGMICGSREEAALNRLKKYTRQESKKPEILLAEVPASDLQEYIQSKGIQGTIFVPESAEKRFLDKLADDFPAVRYGL